MNAMRTMQQSKVRKITTPYVALGGLQQKTSE